MHDLFGNFNAGCAYSWVVQGVFICRSSLVLLHMIKMSIWDVIIPILSPWKNVCSKAKNASYKVVF